MSDLFSIALATAIVFVAALAVLAVDWERIRARVLVARRVVPGVSEALARVTQIGHDGWEHSASTCPRCAIDEVLARLRTVEAERDEANEAVEKLAADWADVGLKLDRAEARVEALEAALQGVGWDIGETALCFCSEHWWESDPEDGTRPDDDDHSPACVVARAALAVSGNQP